MCLGEQPRAVGLWVGIPVPEDADLIVLIPTVTEVSQTVNTRRSGNELDALDFVGKAVVEVISGPRQTYLSDASFSLTGRVSLKLVAEDSSGLGRLAFVFAHLKARRTPRTEVASER